jgi:hypothetical protein
VEPEPVARVLEEHAQELMALPGVVGVGVGERNGSPCLRVFVVRRTPDVAAVPPELGGYPVEVEETGEFRAG